MPSYRSILPLAALLVACSSSPEARTDTFDLGGIRVDIVSEPPRVRITNGARVLADIDGGAFAFRSGTATHETLYGAFKVIETASPDWRQTARITSAVREGDVVKFVLEADGGAALGHAKLTVPDPGHVSLEVVSEDLTQNRARMAISCAPSDHFAGLGAQAADVDHRGQNVPLFVSEPGIGKREDDEYDAAWFVKGRKHANAAPIPAVVTSRGTAILLDTYAHANFDLCKEKESAVTLEAWEPTIRFHVFDGPTPLEALSRMTSFTGRPWMPPPWAFAPWNDAVFGSDSVLKFAKSLRDAKIPSSAIWSEDFRGGLQQTYGYRIAPNWRPDPTLYPDIEKLIADLKAQGFAMQLYFNPHVIEKADVAEEARTKGLLLTRANGEPYLWSGADGTFGRSGLLDLTKPEARDWAKGLLKEAIGKGSLGWMADFGEWMPIDDAKVSSGEDPAIVHGRYPVLWQEVNRDAMRESGKIDEMCVYHRSAHLRSQGATMIMWGGDQRTSFEKDDGLPTIIPIGLGLSATGFPFYSHDIAGYQFLGNKPPAIATKELFFRWTELGAWTPIMRTHHGIKVTENWTLTKDTETTDMWRRYASLHIQLYPYWRGLAVRGVREGRPLWIPMGLLHPDEPDVWGVRDQFYVGDAVLVAPVMEDGARERKVTLPRRRFAPLLSKGSAIQGPATLTVPAALDETPVFIGAGGLVPMTKEPAMTLFEGVAGVPGLETTRGDRILYVGLGADGEFAEEDGARYVLRGAGLDTAGLALDAEGGMEVTGNAKLEGKGFALELSGHPAERKTRVVFR